jgi:integrase
MFELQQRRQEIEALALQFVILTNCRTGDITGTRQRYRKHRNKPPLLWDHIKDKVWAIPAIKTASTHDPKPFEIPLSDAAMDVLDRARKLNPKSDIVFPTWRNGQFQPLAENAMRDQIGIIGKDRRRCRPDFTVHGMRTAFRTWAGEKTSVERDVIETAMSHKVFSEDKAEAAYKEKITFFNKRKVLMQRWADFITGKRNVVSLKRAA